MAFPFAAAAAALAPSLGQLFGGGPDMPDTSPEAMQRQIMQFYRLLMNSPVGQQMLNQASLSGNLAAHGIRRNLAAGGGGDSVIGQIAGGGAQGISAMNRMQVLAKLFEAAQGMQQQNTENQFRAGAFNWQNPSGARAALGSLGTSLFPLLQGAGTGVPKTDIMAADPDAWKGWPGAGGTS